MLWSGQDWELRTDAGGPQYNGKWASATGATVDGNGYLRLKVQRINDEPHGAEIISTRKGWGYGTYRFTVGSAVNSLYPNIILGLFTYDQDYEPTHNEIDIEAGGWGHPNPQWDQTYFRSGFGDEPVNQPVGMAQFPATTAPVTVHEFEWLPGKITWRSWLSADTSGAPTRVSVAEHGKPYTNVNTNGTYTGIHKVPVPRNEKVLLNLWVTSSNPASTPDATPETEVVIRSFDFTPYRDTEAYAFNTTLSTEAGPLPVLEGNFTFDRGWSPVGQGRFTVPLSAWEATGIDPLERARMYVRTTHTNFHTAGTLAALLPAGSLGSAAWPQAPLSTFGTKEPSAGTVAWHVWLRSVTVDRTARTATLDVQTFEMVMQETVNNYGNWMPQQLAGGGYDAADVLVELLKFVGIQAPVEVTASTVIPASEMSAWEFGQTVWDYWDRVRLLAELGYFLNPTTGIITISAPAVLTGTLPAEVISHEEEYGSASEESATYADSLAVVWRWTTDDVEHTQRDVAYAGPEGSWRSARRHVEVDRIGPPIVGYAWRAVEQMARFRTMHRVTVPLTPLLLASAPSTQYQSIDFTFGAEPTATLTVLTS